MHSMIPSPKSQIASEFLSAVLILKSGYANKGRTLLLQEGRKSEMIILWYFQLPDLKQITTCYMMYCFFKPISKLSAASASVRDAVASKSEAPATVPSLNSTHGNSANTAPQFSSSSTPWVWHASWAQMQNTTQKIPLLYPENWWLVLSLCGI